jgi:hypothetical protein
MYVLIYKLIDSFQLFYKTKNLLKNQILKFFVNIKIRFFSKILRMFFCENKKMITLYNKYLVSWFKKNDGISCQ